MKYTENHTSITKQEIDFYKSIINDLDIVFDVGCKHDNIFYDLNPKLEIHLFDPHSRIEKKIKNLKNVYFNNFALGNECGSINYILGLGRIAPYHKNEECIRIKIDTLKRYCDINNITHIDLLKIDTEGWDFEVIKGAGKLIWDIDYIQFEGDWKCYGYDNTIDDIFNYFPKEYKIYSIGGRPTNYIITKHDLHYKAILRI